MGIDTDRHLASSEAMAESLLEDAIHDGLLAIEQAHDAWMRERFADLLDLANAYDLAMCDAWHAGSGFDSGEVNPHDHDCTPDPFDDLRDSLRRLVSKKG